MRRLRSDAERYAEAVWRQQQPRREAERAALMENESPRPRAITLALDTRGLEGPEVDRACGGEEPMVDEWEAGIRVPTPEQVVALAELTGFCVEFFYRDHPLMEGPVFICGGGGCRIIFDTGSGAGVECPNCGGSGLVEA